MQSPRILTDVLKRDGNNFDVLRLTAALGVIVGHAYSITPHPPLQDGVLSLLHFDYSGSLAVKFFFFLSGLLVTNSIISNHDAFKFLLKRAFRIFPGLLLCLLITVFIIGPFFTKLPLGQYFSNVDTWTYLKNNFILNLQWKLTGVFSDSKFGLNGSLWTLPYEVLCYIFLAIFYGLGLLKNKIVSNIFFILIIAASFLNPAYLPAFFAQNPESHLLPACFAIGGLFANNKNRIVISIYNLILMWLLVWTLKNSAVYQFIFYIAFFYSALFIASLILIRKYLKLPFDASYGVYVYGFMIQQCIFHLFPSMGLHNHQLLASFIAVLFGIFSWYLVEKRFIAMGNKWAANIEADSLKNKLQAVYKNTQTVLSNRKGYYTSNFLIFCLLTITAVLIHAIVLKFIFPGYYSPLYPQHSDFYIPVTFANSNDTFASLLFWPRPITMIFAKFIGYFGIKGSIAWVILIVCMNCSLSALLLIRIFKVAFNWKLLTAFAIYSYLLFSQPFFYVFYAQDIGAQLSYFFLILGGYLFYSALKGSVIWSNILLFLFSLLAFLSKETYGLAALTFGSLWFLYCRKTSFLKAFLPVMSISAALLIALVINIFIKSIFVDLNAAAGSPYQISLKPKDLFFEWALYAKQAMNIANVIVLLLIGYLLWKGKNVEKRELLFVTIGCFAGAILSWLPNALLPNHHYNGYSFNGAYILYLPLLFLTILWDGNIITKPVLVSIAILCLMSPLLNIKKYKFNEWVLIQEDTQRNLLNALDPLIDNIHPAKDPQKILIEGITFPFHPFAFPQSLRVFPNAKYANFDILNYDSMRIIGERIDLVRFINPKDTNAVNYKEKWIFDKDGKLVTTISILAEKVFQQRDSTSGLTVINQENFTQFTTSGFYNPEGGIRWTTGQASIGLNAVIEDKDSLIVKLNTYLPPICKDISPQLSLADINNKEYKPVIATKKENIFYYLFIVDRKDKIQKINIISMTIDASPDKRVLSFPFMSLTINSRP